MTNVAIVVQARLASRRLPFKVMKAIGQRSMLDHVLERAAFPFGAASIVLTTPPEDRDIVDPEHRYSWVPHTPPDVLSGYYAASKLTGAERIVRITADCPFLCPSRIVEALSRREAFNYDYVALLNPPGSDVEVFTAPALLFANATAVQREHVGQAIFSTLSDRYGYSVEQAALGMPWLAVDTQIDLDRARAIYDALDNRKDYSIAATLRAWEKAGRP